MQVMATGSIWRQPSLVPTPQPVLSSFPCYANKLNVTTVTSTRRKKTKQNKNKKEQKKKHSASVFETLESFETEHLFFLAK